MSAVTKMETPAPVARSEANSMVSMLERVLMNPEVPVERLEKLLELQDRELARRAKTAFIVSMGEMQPLLPTIDRNGCITIHNKDDVKNNAPSPRVVQQTKFAAWEDIAEAIRPLLGQHGFTLTFSADRVGDQVVVSGYLRHRDGHEEKATLPLALDTTGSKNNVQAVGSSISYGKRYTAGMLLNIVSRAKADADDDGRAADLPAFISVDQVKQLRAEMTARAVDEGKFCDFAKIERLEDLSASMFDSAIRNVQRKPKADKAHA